MILVASGLLVLLAVVLLVAGLLSAGLGLVYASIAVSLLAFGLLFVAVLQRRDLPDEREPLRVAAPARPVADVGLDVLRQSPAVGLRADGDEPDRVVADGRVFHRPECVLAGLSDGQPLRRADAAGRYRACTRCQP